MARIIGKFRRKKVGEKVKKVKGKIIKIVPKKKKADTKRKKYPERYLKRKLA